MREFLQIVHKEKSQQLLEPQHPYSVITPNFFVVIWYYYKYNP